MAFVFSGYKDLESGANEKDEFSEYKLEKVYVARQCSRPACAFQVWSSEMFLMLCRQIIKILHYQTSIFTPMSFNYNLRLLH